MFGPATPSADGFLGVGTLIGRPFPEVSRIHVFSSGVGYDPIAAVHPSNHYWCVRGPLSARVLNLPTDRAIIDGGILAPERLGIGRASASAKPVVVPHWQSMLVGGWDEACNLAGFSLIDPMQPPEKVIGAIASAPLVMTESLHGAIIADVLRIPWIAFVTTGNVPLFKWFDWTASVRTPLRIVPVRPPSPRALALFGRPKLGTVNRAVEVGEDQAFDHFMKGINIASSRQQRGAGAVARGLLARLGERIDGVTPQGTALALQKLASSAAPQLSPPGVVEERRASLLDRLEELRAAHATGDLAAA
ncbi:polysaccharide pyruvyl transferase family protein [Sphingomonas aerophila]|uniref:Succinoglycan biosynthesis protein ExoV n=1 Tax=Sphingomonas aerophila TaxID=1344948 RepID=A0A7W9EVI5_9SPHN|nr:polysaccharide pyruvyl transferase family protein [Sphingomonas aerophila]MBB5714742.1 succinoglycan biosynthesis protein ExoV [Sphingomonas aerophila]